MRAIFAPNIALAENLVAHLNYGFHDKHFEYRGVDIVTDGLAYGRRRHFPQQYRNLPIHAIACTNMTPPMIDGQHLDIGQEYTWEVNEGYIEHEFQRVIRQLINDAHGHWVLRDRIYY